MTAVVAAGPVPAARPASPSRLSLAVRRETGTVVVAVRGPLDARNAETLDRVLGDLIEGQGNLRVLVDLTEADFVEAELRPVLRVPAEWARRRGAEFSVRRPGPGAPTACSRLGIPDG